MLALAFSTRSRNSVCCPRGTVSQERIKRRSGPLLLATEELRDELLGGEGDLQKRTALLAGKKTAASVDTRFSRRVRSRPSGFATKSGPP